MTANPTKGLAPTRSRIEKLALVLMALGAVLIMTLAARGRPNDPCLDPDRQRALESLPASIHVRSNSPEESGEMLYSVTADLAADPKHTLVSVLRTFDVAATHASGSQPLRIPMDPHETWHEILMVDGEPIRVEWTKEPLSKSTHQVGRILFLGRRAVHSLFGAQLASAFSQLRSGTEPITIYLVEIIAPTSALTERTARATDWLVSAARQFRATCGPAQ